MTMSAVLTESAQPPGGDIRFLHRGGRLFDHVIEEIRGRQIRIGTKWAADFASCNYLGFDLDEEILDAVEPAVRHWGTHPSWSRLLGNSRLYMEIEERLTDLLGSQDSLVLPTITHIHLTVLPVLANGGCVFLDARGHRMLYEGCKVAEGLGARLMRYPSGDIDRLEQLLTSVPRSATKVICTDGVDSMTGNVCDVPAMAALARKHDALLYVDDAHGFGVIGDRTPDESTSYGVRGNSVVRHVGETYDNVVLVGGFSKAYSSMLAFLAVPKEVKEHLKIAASPYLYSGPVPVASLATTLAGFDVNATRGDRIRASLHDKTRTVLATVSRLGLACPNRSGLPIIEIPLSRPDDLQAVWQYLFDAGIYVTPAAYPLVPRSQVGFRIQVTSANSTEEIDVLCSALIECADRFDLQGC